MRTPVMISIVVATLVVLAWPALSLWQWVQVQRIYSSGAMRPPAVTAEHVAALRKLRFAWTSFIESGGPIVDPWTPYGSDDMADDLGRIIGTRNPVTIARFHREVSAVLIEALRTCTVPAGRYRLAHLDNAWMEQRLRRDLTGRPAARVDAAVAEIPRLSRDMHFDFTDQHRRLLREIKFEWPDARLLPYLPGRHPTPMIDFKHPFGDMSAYEIDMAAILERPRPPDGASDAVLARLYWETWPALQVFVEHAPLETCIT